MWPVVAYRELATEYRHVVAAVIPELDRGWAYLIFVHSPLASILLTAGASVAGG